MNSDYLPDLVYSNHDYSNKDSSINEVYINTGNVSVLEEETEFIIIIICN